MTINLRAPELRELKPRIMVCGVGGAGGNAVNNMITSGLAGVDFIVANTDAQALTSSKADRIIQMGLQVTEGLGAGAQPEVGRAAAEEAMEEIRDHFAGIHMVFVTAGMGGGTGTGAAPVIARTARDMGILTVGVVTKPFQFEGIRRMRIAEQGITDLQNSVDTLIVIPNQNLFRVANEKTTFADAFSMADQVLYSGVACITDLMVKEGLINLDFADVRAIMREMGKAMMGTGEASGERRAILAAEAAIANPLLDETSMRGARGLLISITGGSDLTLYEVDEAASRIREEVDEDANIILGATFDERLDGIVRVSVVATGIDTPAHEISAAETRIADAAQKLRSQVVTPVAPAPVARAPEPAPVYEPAYDPAYEQAAPAAYDETYYAPAQPTRYAQQSHAAHEVVIEPIQPKQAPMLYAHQEPAHQPAPSVFVPPAPEPLVRAPRMPTIDDLPAPGRQLLAQAQQAPEQGDSRRRSLLERLASLGRRGADEPTQAAPQSVAPAPVQAPPAPPVRARAPMPPQPAPAARPQPGPVHAEYARRPQAPVPGARQQQLDLHGRIAPGSQRPEEDHLDIPAFLRRQSS
ncbi:MAG: cell division protein FtsZ [Beijerinckiaceae bacterium]|nr:cell division protein FtsZ [Beijerinckiaceae bacterium]